jgi:biotin transport system substrate-specific component
LTIHTTSEIARSALFAALIAGGAFVTVPIGPVPFTLQVFCVLLTAMLLGPRLALLAVAAYLTLGLVAPVYAGGASGLGALVGPTGGFLVGFIPAVLVTGWLVDRSAPATGRLLLAGLAGLVPIYALGATWLALQLDLGAGAAFGTGVLPFVTLDVVKAGLAAVVARSLVSSPLGLLAPQRDR